MVALRIAVTACAKIIWVTLAFGMDIIWKESGKNILYDQIFEIGSEVWRYCQKKFK